MSEGPRTGERRTGERRDEGRQWLRQCSLLVGPNEGDMLELGELRVSFTVKVDEGETPNGASIKVYNLSDATAGRIRKEFTRIILQAGYQGNCSVIFDGNITKVAFGQEGGPGGEGKKGGGEEGGVDTCLEINAGEGDRAYNYALVNTSLAAGSTPEDHVRACMKAFSAKGVEPGYVPRLPGQGLPRGKVMYGMARAYMRDTARRTGTAWSFQKGAMQMVPAKGYLPGEAVVLTAGTGLIGTPKVNDKGIEVKCLLNPRLRVGGRIKLDNAGARGGGADRGGGAGREPGADHDGLYRILAITFSGDTRGGDWYAALSCVGIDETSQIPLDEVR